MRWQPVSQKLASKLQWSQTLLFLQSCLVLIRYIDTHRWFLKMVVSEHASPTVPPLCRSSLGRRQFWQMAAWEPSTGRTLSPWQPSTTRHLWLFALPCSSSRHRLEYSPIKQMSAISTGKQVNIELFFSLSSQMKKIHFTSLSLHKRFFPLRKVI